MTTGEWEEYEDSNDFVNLFMRMTTSALTANQFRLWTGISMVSAALERRVWVKIGIYQCFANQYIMLVAPPGVGKYIIDEAHGLMSQVREGNSDDGKRCFSVAPANVTKAALVDALAEAAQTRIPPSGPLFEYHSMYIAAEEMQVFIPEYDGEFLGVLVDLWNNKSEHRENRRHGPKQRIIIVNPQLNMLMGTQPGWLATKFPPDAWTTGFTARTLMVYADSAPWKNPFDSTGYSNSARQRVLERLAQFHTLFGEWTFSEEAEIALVEWSKEGLKPRPTHSKLQYYCNRRFQHIAKLSLVSAVSRKAAKPIVELTDLHRAWHWLFEIEKKMPDVFRAMIGKSDFDVLEELYWFLIGLYRAKNGKPIHNEQIWAFLSDRTTSERIPGLVNSAKQSGMMVNQIGTTDLWLPRPKADRFGQEQ